MSEPAWALSLPTLLGEVWRRIEAREGATPHPVLATTGNGGPEIRTVALRAADRRAGTFEFHSDAASPKVNQLRRRPRAAVLFWDAEVALQSRFDVLVSVASGEAAADVWAKVPPDARHHYGGTPPGTPIADPDKADAAAEPARFAVLRAYVHRVDVLHLGETRHRRAIYRADNRFAGRWVAP